MTDKLELSYEEYENVKVPKRKATGFDMFFMYNKRFYEDNPDILKILKNKWDKTNEREFYINEAKIYNEFFKLK